MNVRNLPGMARFRRALRAACWTVTFPSSTCRSNSSRSFCTIPVSTMWMQFPSMKNASRRHLLSKASFFKLVHNPLLKQLNRKSYHYGQNWRWPRPRPAAADGCETVSRTGPSGKHCPSLPQTASAWTHLHGTVKTGHSQQSSWIRDMKQRKSR